MSDHLLYLLTKLRTPDSLKNPRDLRQAQLAAQRLRMSTPRAKTRAL